MIKNYVKKDPDPVQAVMFSGFNFAEIHDFLKAKAVYGWLICTKKIRQVRFFDNFTLRCINEGTWLIYDPKTKVFDILPDLKFQENYECQSTITEEKEEKHA